MNDISLVEFEKKKSERVPAGSLTQGSVYVLYVTRDYGDKKLAKRHEGMYAKAVDRDPEIMLAHLENTNTLEVYSFLDLATYGRDWFCLV